MDIAESAVDNDLKKEMLKKQPCFTQFTDTEIDELSALLIEKHFHPGDIIVREGDPVDAVYLIISGTADVRHETVENGELKYESIAKLGANTSIGLNESGFYSLSGRRTATVVALTEMTTLYLSVAGFHGFSLSHSHVNETMRQYAKQFYG